MTKMILELEGVKVGEINKCFLYFEHRLKASLASAELRKRFNVKKTDKTVLIFKYKGKYRDGDKVLEFVGVKKR